MILIITIDSDPSVNHVINWVNSYHVKWSRINSKPKLLKQRATIEISNDVIQNDIILDDSKVSFSEFNSVWYRRTPEYPNFDFSLNCSPSLKYTIERNVLNEANELFNYYVSNLKDRYSLGNAHLFNLNKLAQLEIAVNCGLAIPQTIVTNIKTELIKFNKKLKKTIIKPLQNIAFHSVKEKYFIPYTKILSKDMIAEFPENFKPCLFQKYIEKKFEIRSFYLNNKFYSMAIFSQSNKQTAVDFRAYDKDLPNRVVPYNLPIALEEKLRLFMQRFNLNTGSFDLIYSTENNYIFLELNPVGQFGMVSYPCNYFLEKQIALNLIRNKNEKL
jgi:ATP-GRASP peptide maturase of grasp-with-spasm system